VKAKLWRLLKTGCAVALVARDKPMINIRAANDFTTTCLKGFNQSNRGRKIEWEVMARLCHLTSHVTRSF
jgi:hypothetical protein